MDRYALQTMGSDHPYEPPADRPRTVPRAGRAATPVLVTWALCGACVGTSLGATLQLTGRLDGGAGVLGIGGIALGALLGALALRVERRHALTRPEILDARGERGRPLHGALYLAPVVFALPPLLWLVVVGSVAVGSLVPAFAFGMMALALAWGAAKAWSAHRMTGALEALERDRADEARARLEALSASPFAGRSARVAARLNLGAIALQAGELDAAAHWYGEIRSGQAAAFAAAGLALVHLLRGRLDAAEEELHTALASPSARLVQNQADTVRLLLVWRREGAAEAHPLGERLLSLESGPLFQGLLAALRRERGDEAGARQLLEQVEGSLHGALVDRVPELATVAGRQRAAKGPGVDSTG